MVFTNGMVQALYSAFKTLWFDNIQIISNFTNKSAKKTTYKKIYYEKNETNRLDKVYATDDTLYLWY